MRLYHGTTKDSFDGIKKAGVINGRVYLTPEYQTAKDYAENNSDEIVIIEVEIDYNELNADREFVKSGEVDWLEESLENGSCYIDRDISVNEFISIEELK